MRSVRRTAALLESYVGYELIALDMENGRCSAFNTTASFIWQLLDQPKDVDDLRRDLMDIFETDPETFETDLEYGLRRLSEAGLIEISDTELIQTQANA